MECPYCKKEMILGRINQEHYDLKWIEEVKSKGRWDFTPFVKGIKLSSEDKGGFVRTFYCKDCGKFIIEEANLNCRHVK
ncbi:hypothetical protein lbkm_1203 [Lachnospiraceae bacterium KM106-2]|nr:hypothetical protein lbkm_1203 [Lachnospiraceae bacterium KM106-2]